MASNAPRTSSVFWTRAAGGAGSGSGVADSVQTTAYSRPQSKQMYRPCIGHVVCLCIVLHHAAEKLSHIEIRLPPNKASKRSVSYLQCNLRTGVENGLPESNRHR